MLTLHRCEILAELLNPDREDLTFTADWVAALHLESRCNLHNCLLDQASLDHDSFEVVTSISVVEHIPEEAEVIREMWNLLRPGGRLVLTLPCAAHPSEQYIDRDEYGLLKSNASGYFFFQRLYDQRLLESRIFSIVGEPRRSVVYGEKSPGTLQRNLYLKRADPQYPFWQEPYVMGKEFRYYRNLRDLPGEGVVGLEFQKSE
jgi:SAM-dependent methyltransferase